MRDMGEKQSGIAKNPKSQRDERGIKGTTRYRIKRIETAKKKKRQEYDMEKERQEPDLQKESGGYLSPEARVPTAVP